MKQGLSLFAISFVLTFAAAAQSQADPFQYSYNWTASTADISVGAGGVSFSSSEGGTTTQETDTVAANVHVFSAANAGNPDVIPIPASGSNYSLTVTLTDNAGVNAGAVTFTGLMLGKLTHDSSNLTNAITGVTDEFGVHPGQTFGLTTVDGSRYVVSYNGFAAPGPEAQHNQGALSFHLAFEASIASEARVAAAPFTPSAPEPSSIVLGCFGLPFLGGFVLRRKADSLAPAV